MLKVACRLKQVGVQNLSSDIYKFDPDSFLTQFYTLLSANLSTQSRANLFHLVYELFLNVIERFAKDVRNDTYNHYNYNNILYLFLNLFDHSNDINYFKNYLLPVLSKIFEHLGDDLIDYLYSKLLDSKFNHNDKKTGYHLLFVMNEFHQLLHDLLASKKSRSINQLLFCFMLMDFDKQRCTEILGLKEGDLAVDILEIFARNHASLISNSMLTQQSTHCKSAAAADVTMQDETPSAAMLLDSGNSIFSVSNKRSAINEDEKDKKIQRTNSPHSPR